MLKKKQKNQESLFEIKEVWEEEWEDMPEYSQEDKKAHRTIFVHFRNQKDVDDFSKLIDQKIYPNYKSYWYPKMDVKEWEHLRWVDEEDKVGIVPSVLPEGAIKTECDYDKESLLAIKTECDYEPDEEDFDGE